MSAPAPRPHVSINMAMTADGKITSARRERPAFASREDRRRMDRLRAGADALLVAAGTVRADNPSWHVRTAELRRGDAPHRVLVTASADVPADSRFFDDRFGGRSICVTVEDAPRDAVDEIERRAEVWRLGRGRVDLTATLARLAERGVERLLVEGGGELNFELLDAGLVDELYVTVTPALLGGSAAPTPVEGAGWPMAEQRRLRLLDVERVEDELFLRWAVERP